jgi:hypothetical protein
MTLPKEFFVFFFFSLFYIYILYYYIIVLYIILLYNIKKGPEKKIKKLYDESNLPFWESMSNFPFERKYHAFCDLKLVFM